MADPKIRYDILANAEGAESVDKLAIELEKLDKAFDPAVAARAQALANELRDLGAQQTAVTVFRDLHEKVDAASAALETAQAAAQKFGQQIAATDAPTRAQAGQMQKLRDVVQAAKDSLQAETEALDKARGNLTKFGISVDEVAGKSAELNIVMRGARQEVQSLGEQSQAIQRFKEFATATDEARVALTAADAAIETFKREMIDADAPTRVEAQELAKLAETARLAQVAFQQQAQTQAQASTALRALGVDTERLVTTQARGRTEAAGSATAFDKLGASVRAASSAEQAAEAEIRQINAGLEKLAFNTRVSGDEFDKAFTTGQARIAKLRAELATVPPVIDGATKATNLLGEGIRQAALYFSAFTVGREFVDANVQLEALRRTLTLVTGSTDKAAQQIAFLRKTADESGVAIGSISQAYSKFVASAGAAGVSLETVNRTFAAVTKAAGNLGLSSDETSAALLALGQSASKGKVSMEELGQQLGDRLPAVLATTAKGLGITTAEMIKLIQSGELLADASFFNAFAKGVEETFVKGATQISGFQAELGRLKNTWNDFLTSLGDSGVMSALADTLKLLGPIVLGVGAALVTTGKALGTVAGATVDLSGKLLTLDFKGLVRGLQQGRDAARELTDEFNKKTGGVFTMLDLFGIGSKKAADSATDLGKATKDAGVKIGDAATESLKGAKAQGDLATATLAGGTAAAKAGDRWTELNVAYNKLIEKSQQSAEEATKLAAAKKAEGDAAVKLAELGGNELHVREAISAAAEANAKAILAVASAKESEADLTQIKIGALRQEAIDTNTLTDARKAELAELELKLKVQRAEADGAKAQADAARIEASTRAIAIQTAKDNSAALIELKQAYEFARNELAITTLEEQKGVATKAQVDAATQRLAAAEALYHDALDDTSSALARKAERQKLDFDLTQAKLSLEKAVLQSQLDLATLNGDEAGALDARVKLKQLEIKIIEAKVAATKLEAQATLAKAEADKAALEAEGKLTDAARLSIDASIANAKVKLLEAEAQGQQVKVLQQQLANLQTYGTEAGRATQATQRHTAALNENVNAAKGVNTTFGQLGGNLSTATTGMGAFAASSRDATTSAAGLANSFSTVGKQQVTMSQGYVDLITRSDSWSRAARGDTSSVAVGFDGIWDQLSRGDGFFATAAESAAAWAASTGASIASVQTSINALATSLSSVSDAALKARNAAASAVDPNQASNVIGSGSGFGTLANSDGQLNIPTGSSFDSARYYRDLQAYFSTVGSSAPHSTPPNPQNYVTSNPTVGAGSRLPGNGKGAGTSLYGPKTATPTAASTSTSTTPTATATSTTHTVNVTVNGQSSSVNTASAADSTALVNLLKSLESAARSSGTQVQI